jgi:hypothetical protein
MSETHEQDAAREPTACCQCETELPEDELGTCIWCEGLVCTDCCAHTTVFDEIDYPICADCYEAKQRKLQYDRIEADDREEARRAKLKAQLHSPAACAKRRATQKRNAEARAIAREKAKAERRERMREGLASVMAEFAHLFR